MTTSDQMIHDFLRKDTAKSYVLDMPIRTYFSEFMPAIMMLGSPTPIDGLPKRTDDGQLLLEGGNFRQAAIGDQVWWIATALGCLYTERHGWMLSRFPVVIVFTPEDWERVHADPEFSLAKTMLAVAPESYAKFKQRSEQNNTDV